MYLFTKKNCVLCFLASLFLFSLHAVFFVGVNNEDRWQTVMICVINNENNTRSFAHITKMKIL